MSQPKTKSNATWILGIIGFALSLPQVICSILCAGAASTASKVSAGAASNVVGKLAAASKDVLGTNVMSAAGSAMDVVADAAKDADLDKAVGATTATLGIIVLLPVICTFAGFILSFLGKSKYSMVTGILLILLALVDVFVCAVNIAPLAIAGAVLFFCSGIVSIVNAKRV